MERPTVAILIDALGFDLAERHGFSIDGLNRRLRLRTVLGFSQAALTSITTGLPPSEHGLWMMYGFGMHSSPFGWLRRLPASISMRRRWLRRLIRWKLTHVDRIDSYYDLYSVPREVLPYLDIPARRSLFVPGGVPRAGTIFDDLRERRVPIFIRDYRTPEREAFNELETAVRSRAALFYFLYTASLDAELHRFGSNDERIGHHLSWYRTRIEKLLSASGDARVLVFGDHGMCDVTDTVDVAAGVGSLALEIPDDYVPFYDATLARFKVFSGRAERSLRSLLSAGRGGRLLSRPEMEELGVSFPDGRFGDLVFLADPGTLILPSFMGREPVAGMHGYHPDASCMYSVLLSNCEHGSHTERSICDMARVMVPDFDTMDWSGKR